MDEDTRTRLVERAICRRQMVQTYFMRCNINVEYSQFQKGFGPVMHESDFDFVTEFMHYVCWRRVFLFHGIPHDLGNRRIIQDRVILTHDFYKYCTCSIESLTKLMEHDSTSDYVPVAFLGLCVGKMDGHDYETEEPTELVIFLWEYFEDKSFHTYWKQQQRQEITELSRNWRNHVQKTRPKSARTAM